MTGVPMAWVVDSGSGNHLAGQAELPHPLRPAICRRDTGIRLATANGIISADEVVLASIPGLGADAEILILDSCPRVLSLGRLIEDNNCKFSWIPGRAWITDSEGIEHDCVVHDYVPSLSIELTAPSAAAIAGPAAAPGGSEDPMWQLFCLEHGLDPALGMPQTYADEALEAPHGDLRSAHRPKTDTSLMGIWTGLVTRTISAKDPEFRSAPCMAALEKELANLRKRGVWDESTVCEWSSLKKGSTALCGRLFAIMGEKNAESLDASSRSYKARVVFAGNNIQTTDGVPAWELFQEVSQAPAAMQTVRGALGIAALRGFEPKVRDATQAFIQSRIDGPDRPETWVRLPKQWWPDSWHGKFHDPVVKLRLALYGHPESGALWDKHLGKVLLDLGWRRVESHPGFWIHEGTGAIMTVYVDDLMMAAPADREAELWRQIEAKVEFGDPPTPIAKFLGGHHVIKRTGVVTDFSCGMREFLVDAAAKFKVELGVTHLTPARSPHLEEDFVPQDMDTPGKHAATASSHLMKLLFAARLCRPDILVAITRLASKVSTWGTCHDRALMRLFQYIEHHPGVLLTGSLRSTDAADCVLAMSPDADLAGDMETTKSTSGLWLEVRSADGERCWPLAWRSKRQGSTASSTCEAEYISLHDGLKKEALPMVDMFSQALSRPMGLLCLEDNTQCIAAVKKGYSPALRHLHRTERIALGVAHEQFFGENTNFVLEYQASSLHKGDSFTKKLQPNAFEEAVVRLKLLDSDATS
jgi:hypothetical protein